jgi:RNA polymerase sigma-70 factor (ECF subfamily)
MVEKEENKITFIHSSLIEGCRKNDEIAQREIYNLYYKAMYNISLRIIGNSAEAEDIMQDSFLKAFRNISACRENSAFGGWLKRIVVNQSIDALRVKAKIRFEEMKTIPSEMLAGEVLGEAEGFAESAINVKKCISELPEGYKLILTLYLLEGYDHEEIGQILNIKPSTSRSQFARARQKLMEMLKEKGIGL